MAHSKHATHLKPRNLFHVLCSLKMCDISLRALFPLTAFKNARNPKFVRNLSQRLFLGVPVRGTEIWKNLSKFEQRQFPDKFRQISTNFCQISVRLTGTPKNNRWDKFRTNLGFRAFLKAVRGKRVRNPEELRMLVAPSRASQRACQLPYLPTQTSWAASP